MKISSRRHHCEVFGAKAIMIIATCLEGLLLIHNTGVPIFCLLGLLNSNYIGHNCGDIFTLISELFSSS